MNRTLNPLPTRSHELHPTSDPLAALSALPGAFVLRSSLLDPGSRFRQARWTLFGADPFATFRGGDHDVAGAFRTLSAQVAVPEEARTAGVPFAGGAVGYWAYDHGRRIERLPSTARDDLRLPELVVGFYDVVGAHDHDSGRTWLFSSGLPADGDARVARARERLEQFRRLLESPAPSALTKPPHSPRVATSNFTADGYRRAVDDVRDAIRRGDIFQANLSQRWTLPLTDAHRHGLAFDAALRERTPSPFAATLLLGDHAVLSASPELFL